MVTRMYEALELIEGEWDEANLYKCPYCGHWQIRYPNNMRGKIYEITADKQHRCQEEQDYIADMKYDEWKDEGRKKCT